MSHTWLKEQGHPRFQRNISGRYVEFLSVNYGPRNADAEETREIFVRLLDSRE